MLANLVGRIHIREIIAKRQLFSDNDYYVFPEDAVQNLANRLGMTSEQYYALEDYAKQKAFTVKALANDTLINRLKEILEISTAEGETKQGFLKSLKDADLLNSVGLGENNWYWELVQRNNAMSAYNGGRLQECLDNGDVEYLEYIGIDDDRQSEICSKLDGIKLPKSDPFWLTHTPPNHHGCRSTIRPVIAGTQEAKVIKLTRKVPDVQPAKGFASNPAAA